MTTTPANQLMRFRVVGRVIALKVGPEWGRFEQKCLTHEPPKLSRYQQDTRTSFKHPRSWGMLVIKMEVKGTEKYRKIVGKGHFSSEGRNRKESFQAKNGNGIDEAYSSRDTQGGVM